MGHKGISKRKSPVILARQLSKDKASASVFPVGQNAELSPIGSHEANILILRNLHQLSWAAMLEDAPLMEKYFANDSLGG
jgi:hypothetical protein